MAVKRIDMNDFDMVKDEQAIGKSGFIFTPQKMKDGTQLPETYWKRKTMFNLIEDVDSHKWYEDIRIATIGSADEYERRVDWWFDNAQLNSSWNYRVNKTFNKDGFDLQQQLNNMVVWLKSRTPVARKSFIGKYVWNRLTKQFKLYKEMGENVI